MKNIKGFTLGLVFGLALALSGVGFAQKETQTEPSAEKQSCCAMKCCCQGDSCRMTKHDATKNQPSQHECCCCNDSCETRMKKKEG
jgi:hypothetical protein